MITIHVPKPFVGQRVIMIEDGMGETFTRQTDTYVAEIKTNVFGIVECIFVLMNFQMHLGRIKFTYQRNNYYFFLLMENGLVKMPSRIILGTFQRYIQCINKNSHDELMVI
jgi:hypothetical protein